MAYLIPTIPVTASRPSLIEMSMIALSLILVGCGGGDGSFNLQASNDSESISPPVSGVDPNGCAEVISSVRMSTPTTLINTASSCDYYITGFNQIQSRLDIEAGTTLVMAQNAGISLIDGELHAVGTANQPITIRGEQPLQGFWSKINMYRFRDSELAHVNISDGGQSGDVAALDISTGRISIENVSIRNSYVSGLRLDSGTELLSFSNNRFLNNAQHGLMVDLPLVPRLDTQSDYLGIDSPNTLEGIRLDAIALGSTDPDSLVLRKLNAPYDISYFGTNKTDLKIEAGVELLNPSLFFFGASSVTINGTADEPVVFRRSVGESEPWDSIDVRQFHVNHAIFSGGKNGLIVGHNYDVTLENTIVSDHAEYGIACEGEFNNPVTADNLKLGENVVFRNNRLGDMNDECP